MLMSGRSGSTCEDGVRLNVYSVMASPCVVGLMVQH
jgi:hypothetical protein